MQLKELHNVVEIAFDESSERYVVDAQKLSATTGEVIEVVRFSAKKLFVSAGTMGSNTLLTRAKGRTLTNLNEHVGTRFGCNGDSFVVRVANSDGTSTSPALGAPGAFGVFAYNATGGPIVIFDQNVVWGPEIGLNNLIVQIGMGIPDQPGYYSFPLPFQKIGFINIVLQSLWQERELGVMTVHLTVFLSIGQAVLLTPMFGKALLKPFVKSMSM